MLNDIAIYCDSESNVKFPYFQDDDWTIVNPVYQCFKRVGEIYFNNKTVMKLLEMILKTDFNEIELLNFHEVDPSLFWIAMNPSIFNFKVQRIGYRNPNWPLISNKALSNIDKINPKELIFSGFTFNPNWFRVLSNLPNNITAYFGCDSSNTFNLKFVNADVFIKSNKESLKLQCKEIWLDWRNLDNNEIFFLENEIICICYFKGIKIDNFKNEINEQDSLSHAFNVERTEISNYLTIQMNRGSEIMLSLDELLQLFENKGNKLIFSSLSLHIKLVIKLETLNEVIEFSKVSMHIPKHWELEIVEIDYNRFIVY